MWFCLVGIYFFLVWGFAIASEVPVVYVIFGSVPEYLQINVELAARSNPVVLIADTEINIKHDERRNIKVLKLQDFSRSAESFAPFYIHLSRDNSQTRRLHELRCVQRWYILMDYMKDQGVEKAFFGDGDSSVFVNVTEAFAKRSNCSAVFNVEAQGHNFHWVGAGEASLWTTAGISDFCTFTTNTYQHFRSTLMMKRNTGSSVVDMSFLWLWWVAQNADKSDAWEIGRPYNTFFDPIGSPNNQKIRLKFDDAFNHAKKLHIPSVATKLKLCNGMDVVERTAFDHMHGWFDGYGFSFDLDGKGVPYVIGSSLPGGGRPESLEPAAVAELEKQKLYLMNLHYQGDSKHFLPYDICRVLLLTGDKYISDDHVAKICDAELNKHPGYPCQDHEKLPWGDKRTVCA